MSVESPHQRASLADVARLAGVSSQTVSRVVRGSSLVAEKTRAKVMAALEELSYRPNVAARSLSRSRTGIIHIVNATPLFHGHARAFLKIVEAVGELGLQLSASIVPAATDIDPQQLFPIGVDGVIVLGGHSHSSQWAELINSQAPVLFVGQRKGLPSSVPSVGVDQNHGSWLATRHLLSSGRRRLLHVCGPADWLDAQERRDGFLAACAEAGVSYEKLSSPTWDAARGYELAKDISDDIDGVFASNDQLALGVMRRLHERGLRVPEDVAVVGYDDAVGSDCFWPPLTTVRQPFQEVAHAAVENLVMMIEGGQPENSLIKPQLVVRDSAPSATRNP